MLFFVTNTCLLHAETCSLLAIFMTLLKYFFQILIPILRQFALSILLVWKRTHVAKTTFAEKLKLITLQLNTPKLVYHHKVFFPRIFQGGWAFLGFSVWRRPSKKFKGSIKNWMEPTKQCCIFWPAFGCSSLLMLVFIFCPKSSQKGKKCKKFLCN